MKHKTIVRAVSLFGVIAILIGALLPALLSLSR